MIVCFLRWACYYREVRIPFTRWIVWLEPNRCAGQHPGGFFLDVDDKDGLIQLGDRWQVWMHNYGPSYRERFDAWLERNPEIKAAREAQDAQEAEASAAKVQTASQLGIAAK